MSGMKYKDIADKYEVSLSTVKSWKQRYSWNRKGTRTKKKKVCVQNNKGAPEVDEPNVKKGKHQEWIEPDGLLKIEGWARDGLTYEQIATNMGIARSTLNEWVNKYPDISDTLKKGREVVDRQVENALLKRALGYSYKETTKERIIDSGQKKRHGGESQLTENEWDFAVKYFNNKCCYCGCELGNMATKDHIKPLRDGGKLSRENIIPCCSKCNSSKKDNEMLSWYQSQKFYNPERAKKIYDYVAFVESISDMFDDKNSEIVTTKIVEKQVVPDTTAQIFWLKNRKPNEWRDKVESIHHEEVDKRKLDIELLKLELQQKEIQDPEQQAQDNFLDALNASAKEVWTDGE